MGSWRITVEGVGYHHNKNEKIDADLATKEFVAKLKQQGHTLTGENLLELPVAPAESQADGS